MHKYPDVLYGQYSAPGAEHAAGDIFYFDYGCITFWGLSQKQARNSRAVELLRLCACLGVSRLMGALTANNLWGRAVCWCVHLVQKDRN